MVGSLESLLTVSAVAELAGPRSYARGVGYHHDNRVEVKSARGSRVEALVRGTMPQWVCLWVEGRQLESCSRPMGEDEEFCKHCVAVALVGSSARLARSGFYLWQDSPWRAQEWATEQHGDEAAVVIVRASLDGGMDLLNPRWQTLLRDADAQFVIECMSEGREVPTNRPSGNRARDCATINWFCDRAVDNGLTVRSVRAIFEASIHR